MDGQILDLEDHVRRGPALLREHLVQLAAHHPLRHVHDRDVSDLFRRYHRTVAQNDDPVADRLHFLQLVGDVDDRRTLIPQSPHESEKNVDLVLGEHRRRLIHDQELGVGRHGLADLHHLLLRRAQFLDPLLGPDIHAELGEELAGPGHHGLLVQKPVLEAELGTEKDIVVHGQLVDQIELLGNETDAEQLRIERSVNMDRRALEEDLARRGSVNSAQYLHQGRFAGAILPDDSENFSSDHLDVDVFEHVDRGKVLRDAPCLQEGFTHA